MARLNLAHWCPCAVTALPVRPVRRGSAYPALGACQSRANHHPARADSSGLQRVRFRMVERKRLIHAVRDQAGGLGVPSSNFGAPMKSPANAGFFFARLPQPHRRPSRRKAGIPDVEAESGSRSTRSAPASPASAAKPASTRNGYKPSSGVRIQT
jgi:hypothetical protein